VKRAEPIAIIGMRGRFPGANDLDQFWKNLAEGVESIAVLTPDEMRAAGIPDHISRLPGYVNAAPVLDGVDQFDAQFFGFSARDAALTDPQHRLFLETAWEALEDAGYDPARYPGAIGVFGGCELSSYLYHLHNNLESLKYVDGMTLMVTNDKDHLCTQVSYRLNLKGPSVAVQTTCSTSLVAVSLACESLEHGRCDMALAGGVTVKVPQRGGYFYTAGSILSPDGHCRPFDANAQGTIVGSGVGLVVLRRLKDALQAGDNIRAVILGTGLNNDGNDKVGYTAPSYRGQAAAVRAAHESSGVAADSIGYVEAHGTGTILGDPIEVSALTEVFRASTSTRGFCGIGSVKSNFGHLSCAAGVAGLIKTVLALQHQAIPPTLHYTAPNPAIDLASSPFFVATNLLPWTRNGHPRRAGVSSFGVGGTNAHLVVEEAPRRPAPEKEKFVRPHQLMILSARSEAALGRVTERLQAHLEAHPELDPADVAFTLQAGRRFFKHRRALVPGGAQMDGVDDERSVIFMFPGQGSQYPGMGAGLYRTEPVFRKTVDHCARLLKPALGADLRALLFPGARRRGMAAEELKDTKYAQPALFAVGFALAELWRSWGVQPAAMIGHSVGEYVAAALAGVMTLEDALQVIARRGKLISALPRGSMLAVMSPAEPLNRFLDHRVSLAAINAPGFCVLSGPTAAIGKVEKALTAEGIAARRLHTSHAFHSSMMDPILARFEDFVSRLKLSPPSLPFVATLHGKWADASVAQPGYWSAQLRSPVRFADAMRTLGETKNAICLEAGPGNTLATFAMEATKKNGKPALCLASLPGPDSRKPDTQQMLTSLGHLWVNGVVVDWDGFHRHEKRRRVSLPTYPFERESYWVGAKPAASRAEEERDTSHWFHRPLWREAPPATRDLNALHGRRVLVLDEGTGLGANVASRLKALGAAPVVEKRGSVDFHELARKVCSTGARLAGVIDCWPATPPGETDLDTARDVSLLGPLQLAHALSSQQTVRPLPTLLVARGTALVHPGDWLDPNRALSVGAARVLPQEHPGLRVAHIDVDEDPWVADLIIAEFAAGAPEPAVALRGGRRYVETFEPVPIPAIRPAANLPEKPVVMITGGLGHLGLSLAEGVFQRLNARLILLARSVQPADEEIAARLEKMRAVRDEVSVIAADLNRKDQVAAAVEQAIAQFGPIDLVVHGAARIDAGAFGAAAETGPEIAEAQFSPKLRGLYHLLDAMRGREPKRWVLQSSISTTLGGLGLAAYAAANAVLDALALKGGENWLSVDWDAWDNAAEAQSAAIPAAIHPPEGREAFLRLLGVPGCSRMLVVTNLAERLQAWVRHADGGNEKAAGVERHPRPNLVTAYVEPKTETERGLAEIWGAQLGVASIGVNDRFFDLGGHSLLAAQIAAEICDRFQIELPVLRMFQAPTIGELALLVEKAKMGAVTGAAGLPVLEKAVPDAPALHGDAPNVAAKENYREFYNDVSRRLAQSGVGDASFFLNYGYISVNGGDEARFEVPANVFNPSSVRLAFELIGSTQLEGLRVLDVGCGRGGTVALMAETFGAIATGVDLAPEAVAFCRKTHQRARFEVGDAEHLPFEDGSFDVVTNVESSHTYPSLRAFYGEVKRVLVKGGRFLYTDLLPVPRWLEVRALLEPLGFRIVEERDITPNVLASCDHVAATRAQAFGGRDAMIDNFLAVPGSAVYEQMKSGAWEYRLLRAIRA